MSDRFDSQVLTVNEVLDILTAGGVYLTPLVRGQIYERSHPLKGCVITCDMCAHGSEVENVYTDPQTGQQVHGSAPSGVFLCSITGKKRGCGFYCADAETEADLQNKKFFRLINEDAQLPAVPEPIKQKEPRNMAIMTLNEVHQIPVGDKFAWLDLRDEEHLFNLSVYLIGTDEENHPQVYWDVPHNTFGTREDEYGKTWRVWKTKPSDTERRQARW